MGTATLTEKGQVTIPRAIRKMLGLTAHQKLLFVPKKGSVEMFPVKGNLLDLFGVFHSKKIRKVQDWQKVRSIVRKKLAVSRVRT